MVPDPKWLEFLKASGWQTTAGAAAFGPLWEEAGRRKEFDDEFKLMTGMSVDRSISLYEIQTGDSLTFDQVERLFTDSRYAYDILSRNRELHTTYRDILSTNVPNHVGAAMDAGYTQMSYLASWYHNPNKNTKWVGPTGHREAVYSRSDGELVTDNLDRGTFNFFPSSETFFGYRYADVLPYRKWGN